MFTQNGLCAIFSLTFVMSTCWLLNSLISQPQTNLPWRRPWENVGKWTIMILSMMGLLLTTTLYQTELTVPLTSYTEANTAVLTKAQANDLLLCVQPSNQQVRRAFLVEAVQWGKAPAWLHGYFLDKQSFIRTDGGIAVSFFDRCELYLMHEDGLGLTDKKIGEILRLGLNPPTPIN